MNILVKILSITKISATVIKGSTGIVEEKEDLKTM